MPPAFCGDVSLSGPDRRSRLVSTWFLYVPTPSVFSYCMDVGVYMNCRDMRSLSRSPPGRKVRWWLWIVSSQLSGMVFRLIRLVISKLTIDAAEFLFRCRATFSRCRRTWSIQCYPNS